MKLISKRALLNIMAATMLATVSPVLAHAPKNGAHGGAQANAGAYHVEMVMQGATLEVFLRDHGDNAVSSDGFRGIAILLVDGKARRILLEPAGENRLSGISDLSLPEAPKGAVQITTPSGSTVQAKFE